MSDEKKQIDQLTRDDLKEVKGGIPYEKPELIDLSITTDDDICKKGRICRDGGADCSSGYICSVGKDPSPN